MSCPASVTLPEPINVVPLRARVPLLLTLMDPPIVEVAAPRVSLPLLTLTVVKALVVRLMPHRSSPW